MYWSRVREFRRPLAGVAAVVTAYVGLGVVLDGSVQRLATGLMAAVVALAVAAGLFHRALNLTGTGRQSWSCMGLAALIWGVGEVAHVIVTRRGEISGPSAADLCFLGAVVLLVVGTLLHPAVATSGLSLLRSVLDGVIIATSLVLLMLLTAPAPDQGADGGELLELVYPLADVALFGVVLMALSRLHRGNRRSMGLVLVALTCFVVGTDTYELGWPFDAGWVLGFLLLRVAARVPGSAEGVTTAEAPSSRRNALHRVVTVLPYASVVVAMSVGGYLYFRGGLEITADLTAVALLLIAAMIVRQSVSVLDASAAARELARGEAYFRSIVQGSSDVTTIVDANLRVVWQSPSVRTLFGLQEGLAVGRSVLEIVHRDDLPELERALATVLPGSAGRAGTASVRARVRDADGRWRDVETSLANHLDTPAIKGLVLHTRDVTERSALESRLHEMAFTDALTGLPNRRLFLDRVEQARDQLSRTGETHTVLAVDLDGFKAVNDLHGHGAGDALLAEVSARLKAQVRDADIVARLGGDEFAILVAGGADEGSGLGERLVSAVAAPYTLDQVTVHVSVSVGVAEAVVGDESAVVLRNADLALRHAKQTGKKHVEVYEPALHQGALHRVAIEHDLAGALERGEIRLAYQPILDLARDQVIGAEALMRWNHPERGEVSPVDFIPVAEDSGQIIELGRWALNEACRQLATWSAAGYELQMAVNVSTRQLHSSSGTGPSLSDDVAAACAAYGVSADHLILEITESAFLESFESVLAELDALHALGVSIALDDFGTGYSSLSYLRRLPVDILKIDREFVAGMTTEDHVAALAELVVRLGDRLGIEVVAEGVETAAEASGVLGIGCVLGQGFHLGRPVAPDQFATVLAAQAVRTAQTGSGRAVPGVTV